MAGGNIIDSAEVVDGYRLGYSDGSVSWPLYLDSSCMSARLPTSEGSEYALSQESGTGVLMYGGLDSEGVEKWRPDGYQEPGRPYAKTFAIPAGIAWVVVTWGKSGPTPILTEVGGGCVHDRQGTQ